MRQRQTHATLVRQLMMGFRLLAVFGQKKPMVKPLAQLYCYPTVVGRISAVATATARPGNITVTRGRSVEVTARQVADSPIERAERCHAPP